MPAQASDVAAAILERCGSLNTYKLQKLVYYTQAWHLTWMNAPAFSEAVEAWENGPVVRELFNLHRGRYVIQALTQGDSHAIDESVRHVIAFVCRHYGESTGTELVDQVHQEAPWMEAFDPEVRNKVITHEAMVKFYGSFSELNDQAWVWTTGAYDHVGQSISELDQGEGLVCESIDDFIASL